MSTSPRSTTLTLLPTITSQHSTPSSTGSASSQRASLATPEVPAPRAGRSQGEGQSGASAPIQLHDAEVEPRRPSPQVPPSRSLAHPTQAFYDVDGGRPLEEPAPSPPECTQCSDLNWQLSIAGEEIDRLDQSRARARETIASLEAKILEGERTVQAATEACARATDEAEALRVRVSILEEAPPQQPAQQPAMDFDALVAAFPSLLRVSNL